MSDIVSKLRDPLRDSWDEVVMDEAADEIESLRLRLGVEEKINKCHREEKRILKDELAALKADDSLTVAYMSGFYDGKKEALKAGQGEPVAVAHVGNRTFYVTANPRQLEKLGFSLEDSCDIPLYTSTPTIPEGWQPVPIEPTYHMLHCGDKFMDGLSELRNAWEAMLAAAPKPGDKE